MPVSATIAVINTDGSVMSYDTTDVGVDPSLSGLGKHLLTHYTDEWKLRLILTPDPMFYDDVSELLSESGNEFIYIFNPAVNQWFFCCNDMMSHNSLPRLTAKHVAPGYVHPEEWIRMSDLVK
jgi:hypothetical protein